MNRTRDWKDVNGFETNKATFGSQMLRGSLHKCGCQQMKQLKWELKGGEGRGKGEKRALVWRFWQRKMRNMRGNEA